MALLGRAGATMFMGARGSMCELIAWGRWQSLRVARKHVAKWDSLPWTAGVVPWPQVESGTPTMWRYEFEPFRAWEFWPRRQFMRDGDDGWKAKGSNAEGIGRCVSRCGEDAAAIDVIQGTKRTVQVGANKGRCQSSVKRRCANKETVQSSRKRECEIVVSDEEPTST